MIIMVADGRKGWACKEGGLDMGNIRGVKLLVVLGDFSFLYTQLNCQINHNKQNPRSSLLHFLILAFLLLSRLAEFIALRGVYNKTSLISKKKLSFISQ